MTLFAIQQIVEARSVEAVWNILSVEMEKFGFDRLFYGFTRFRTPNSLGNFSDMMIMSNHDDHYVSRFLQREVFENAPMLLWASDNVGAMSWGWVARSGLRLTPAQEKVLEFNRKFGVTAGYTISFPDSSSRQKAAIALTAHSGLSQTEVDQMWATTGPEINLINQVAHLKMASLPFPEALKRLSDRQKEVLEWVSDGKTTQDIADIMGLTVATIEKHMRKARESLQVETTAQAVMKASIQRQIFVLDS